MFHNGRYMVGPVKMIFTKQCERQICIASNAPKASSDTFTPTIVFFDEANTTDSIGLIKELMCDRLKDQRLKEYANLTIVAACNPYRR